MTKHVRADEFAPIITKSAEEDGDATAIITKAVDDLKGSMDERFKAVDDLKAKLAKIEARQNRPAPAEAASGDAEVERKSFDSYIRGTATTEELKTLTVQAPGTAGVFVPPTLSTRIIERLAESNPVRALATVEPMSGALVQFPRLVDEVVVGEVGETDTRPESEMTFDMLDVKPFEMSVIVPVSRIALEDAAIDLAGYVMKHMVRKFGEKEAAWFVTGNGTTQAEGILNSALVTTRTTAGAAISTDDIMDTFYDLKSGYSARGSWLMPRAVMALVRKLKDDRGDYIWQPGLQLGQPPTLLGRPVYEASAMGLPAAGATVAVFGDIETAYTIVDRVGIQTDIDDKTGWKNGIVKFLARRRVGGRVLQGEALRKLKIKAA